MKMWRCDICGYLHEGDEAPEFCVKCGAPREKFVLLDEEEAEMMHDALRTREQYQRILHSLRKYWRWRKRGLNWIWMKAATVSLTKRKKKCPEYIR
jgi:hypothetical protein